MMTCLAVCAAMRPKAVLTFCSAGISGVLLGLRLGLLDVLVEVEDLEQQLVADFGLETGATRLLDADLPHRELDLVDDVQDLEQVDVAGLEVEAGLDLAIGKHTLGRRRDRLLDGVDQDVAGDVLLLTDRIDDRAEVDVLFHGVFSTNFQPTELKSHTRLARRIRGKAKRSVR